MADNFDTPVANGTTFATKEVGGAHIPWNLLADANGDDAMGTADDAPGENTLLGRLKAIVTALLAPTPAGDNYIGKQGGDVLIVSQAPAVSTSAYATGDVVGALLTFASIVRGAGLVGLVQLARVFSKSAQTTQLDLILFNANPAESTITDNAAFVLHANDYAKVLGVVPITSWSALGTASIGQSIANGLPVKPASGTTLYGVLVARGALTLGSTSDITVNLGVIPG